MILTKWVLHDPVAGDSYTMTRNPRTMTSVTPSNQTNTWPTAFAVRLAFRTGRKPTPWEFTGAVAARVDYEAMDDWARRPNAIEVTDHYGRVHLVVPVSFEPKPRRSRSNYWRFDYTFKALYVRRIS